MFKVSICIPTYNRKDYLKESLESVFAQTYKDYEVVIVDDGSADGTEEMVKDNGYNVRYYWQKNKGVAVATNKLIELAKGQFISFLDSDDLLMPDAIRRLIDVVTSEPKDIIAYGPYLRIDQNGNVCGMCKRKLYSGYITKYLFQSIFVHSCGSMFPKRALEKIGAFDESLPACFDYDLWLRLSLKYPFVALSKPTFKRRRHPGNLSRTSLANRIAELRVLERFYHEKGGNKAVTHRAAMRRLSKEEYRVGICAARGGDYDVARRFLTKSFRRYPNIKSALRWWQVASKQLIA